MADWIVVTVGLVGAMAAGLFFYWHGARRRRWSAYRAVANTWLAASNAGRRDVLEPWVHRSEINSAALYLQAALLLREERVRPAARAFGMAYHGDTRFESAALLTFACLKTHETPPSDILDQITQTWIEMKRPRLFRTREEFLMRECLAATTRDAPALSDLGLLAWCVVSPAQQARLEQIPPGAPLDALASL